MKQRVFIAATLLIAFTQFSWAQIPFSTAPEKEDTRSGNRDYQKENFTEAEANYKKALDIKNNMPQAMFNLGDAVYQQKRYDSAQKQFQLSAKTNIDPMTKAKAYHNLGNTFLEQKKYEDAIGAYKNSLKLNPKDADTKYNLAYANAMMQKNQGGGGQNNKDQDKKDQQQKNQDQKDQQKQNDQNKDQQKNQQANNQDQKNQQQQQQQAQKPKLSKQDADQLLAAVENEEQKTNQKMQKKQVKVVKVKSKKDW